MRDDERYEIQRAFDLLPYVVGCSWATIWFRMNGIKKPTREDFRKKTIEYFKKIEPVFDSYPKEEKFKVIQKYIEFRTNDVIQKISEGLNLDVEKRYDRYVDYG